MFAELFETLWAMDERGLALRDAAFRATKAWALGMRAAEDSPDPATLLEQRELRGYVEAALASDPEWVKRVEVQGQRRHPEGFAADAGAQAAAGLAGEVDSSPIRVIPVYGMLMQHPSWLTAYGLATSVDQVQMAVRRMAADPQVQAIVLRIHSPGGSVMGVKVLADLLLQVRKEKLVWAHADSMANSGACWIAASCGRFTVTPMGETGSIGAFMVHTSFQKADEMAGIKSTIIRAGKMKASATPYEDLGPEAAAHLQARIDFACSEFQSGIAKARGVPIEDVRNGMGQGAAVDAKDAVTMGLCDEVVSFPDALVKVGRELRARASGRAGASAEEAQGMSDGEVELARVALDFGLVNVAESVLNAAPAPEAPTPKS